ncbi:MAG TPA: TM0106 family RecB-like putative nuclease [Candidatus Eisenbacteria bacterium]|nr:TM0106 family RecB-like putative nuclease [Candidatus Eisenbacteria bacterium]
MAARKPRVSKAAPLRVSASMFYKYDACPHWLYFDVCGDPKKKQPQTKFTEMLLRGGMKHEEDIIAGMEFATVKARGNEARAKATLKLMREGVERIYHGVLMDDEFVGEPDLLERSDHAGSTFGPYHYVAVDIKSAERLTDAHKYQLACYGELLERIQGVRPAEGFVLNGSGVRIGFPLAEFMPQFREAAEAVRKCLAGEPPPPHVSSGCKQSPWFKLCIAYAEERDDIALLYNVKKKVVRALREHGILTVHQAAALDVNMLAGKDPAFKRALLERIVLQAQALIEDRHFIRKRIDLPSAPTELFFDIEGDPLLGLEYLFGFLVRRADLEHYEYQIAERPEKEQEMWDRFLEWIGMIDGDYVVYHYGTYEFVRLGILERKYGGSKSLDRFRDRMVDLNEVVKEAIVFPLYFYSIKDIGNYIDYKRSDTIKGGGESVAFYEEWLEKGDRKKLDDIIEYNKDDVIATRWLKDWLEHEKRKHDEESGKEES